MAEEQLAKPESALVKGAQSPLQSQLRYKSPDEAQPNIPGGYKAVFSSGYQGYPSQTGMQYSGIQQQRAMTPQAGLQSTSNLDQMMPTTVVPIFSNPTHTPQYYQPVMPTTMANKDSDVTFVSSTPSRHPSVTANVLEHNKQAARQPYINETQANLLFNPMNSQSAYPCAVPYMNFPTAPLATNPGSAPRFILFPNTSTVNINPGNQIFVRNTLPYSVPTLFNPPAQHSENGVQFAPFAEYLQETIQKKHSVPHVSVSAGELEQPTSGLNSSVNGVILIEGSSVGEDVQAKTVVSEGGKVSISNLKDVGRSCLEREDNRTVSLSDQIKERTFRKDYEISISTVPAVERPKSALNNSYTQSMSHLSDGSRPSSSASFIDEVSKSEMGRIVQSSTEQMDFKIEINEAYKAHLNELIKEDSSRIDLIEPSGCIIDTSDCTTLQIEAISCVTPQIATSGYTVLRMETSDCTTPHMETSDCKTPQMETSGCKTPQMETSGCKTPQMEISGRSTSLICVKSEVVDPIKMKMNVDTPVDKIISITSCPPIEMNVDTTVQKISSIHSEDSLSSSLQSLDVLSSKSFYQCCTGSCVFSCLSPKVLLCHLEAEHVASTGFLCVHCSLVCSDSYSLIAHLHKHLERGYSKCNYTGCSFSTNNNDELLRHCHVAHFDACEHACLRCKKLFDNVLDFIIHLKMNFLTVIRCPHCDVKDVTKQNVLKHMESEHADGSKVPQVSKYLLCKDRAKSKWPASHPVRLVSLSKVLRDDRSPPQTCKSPLESTHSDTTTLVAQPKNDNQVPLHEYSPITSVVKPDSVKEHSPEFPEKLKSEKRKSPNLRQQIDTTHTVEAANIIGITENIEKEHVLSKITFLSKSEVIRLGKRNVVTLSTCSYCDFMTIPCGSIYDHLHSVHEIHDMFQCSECNAYLAEDDILEHHTEKHAESDEDYLPTALRHGFQDKFMSRDAYKKLKIERALIRKAQRKMDNARSIGNKDLPENDDMDDSDEVSLNKSSTEAGSMHKRKKRQLLTPAAKKRRKQRAALDSTPVSVDPKNMQNGSICTDMENYLKSAIVILPKLSPDLIENADMPKAEEHIINSFPVNSFKAEPPTLSPEVSMKKLKNRSPLQHQTLEDSVKRTGGNYASPPSLPLMVTLFNKNKSKSMKSSPAKKKFKAATPAKAIKREDSQVSLAQPEDTLSRKESTTVCTDFQTTDNPTAGLDKTHTIPKLNFSQVNFDDPDYEFRCKYCTQRGGTLDKFLHHIYYHLHHKPYSCGYCGDMFFTHNRVLTHTKTNHPKRANEPIVKKVKNTVKEAKSRQVAMKCFIPKTVDDEALKARLKIQHMKKLTNRAPKMLHGRKKLLKVCKQVKYSKIIKAGSLGGDGNYLCPYCKSKRPMMSWKKLLIEICYHIHYKPFQCGHCKKMVSASNECIQKHIENAHPGKELKINENREVAKESRMEVLLQRSIEISKRHLLEIKAARKIKTKKTRDVRTTDLLNLHKIKKQPTECMDNDVASKSADSSGGVGENGDLKSDMTVLKFCELYKKELNGDGVPIYYCLKCDYVTEVMKTIYTHTYKHQPRIFKCFYCEFVSYPWSSIMYHMKRIHSTLKPKVINLAKNTIVTTK